MWRSVLSGLWMCTNLKMFLCQTLYLCIEQVLPMLQASDTYTISWFVFVTFQLKFKSSFQQFHPEFSECKNQRFDVTWLFPLDLLSPAHLGHRSNDIQHLRAPVVVARTRAWLRPQSAAPVCPRRDGRLHVCLRHGLHRRLPVLGGHPQCHPDTTLRKCRICVIVWSGLFSISILYLNLLSTPTWEMMLSISTQRTSFKQRKYPQLC